MVQDRGPNTGCMGNTVWCTESNKLTQAAIEPLAPLLEKVGFTGPIDVNCIVTRDEAWFLEFTPRFGYEAIQTFAELVKGSMFDFLYGIATGQSSSFSSYPGFALGVRLSLSPYPSDSDVERWRGVQVLNIPREAQKHVWLADTMKDSEGVPVIAGVDGVVGCVTARGDSVRECQRRVYRTIKNIALTQDLQYRTDIGDGTEDSKRTLEEWGWLNGSA